MYEKAFEQTERLFKPLSEIWAVQAQTAETLVRRQSSVMVDVWNQGVLALQSIPGQRNIEDVLKLQKDYWENLSGTVRELVEDTQGILLETNQKITEILQSAAPEAGKAVKEAAKTVADNVIDASKKAAPAAKKIAEASAPIAGAVSAPIASSASAASPVPPTSVAAAVNAVSSEKKPETPAVSAAAAKLSGKDEKKSPSKSITPPKTAASTKAIDAKSAAKSADDNKSGKLL